MIFSKNEHFSTIIPSILRKVQSPPYTRERIETHDGDFVDVDQVLIGSKKCVILLHGLEGSSDQHYIKSQAKIFSEAGYDIIALNFRTCSGHMNRTTTLYHSGETRDLATLVEKYSEVYEQINLVGFSLGGNVVLKYLGETECTKVNRAVAFSVPIDLEACAYKLASGFSKFYSGVFMATLNKKVKWLQKKHKNIVIKDVDTKKLKTFLEFDEFVTAPLHGFKDAKDYWSKSSSKQFLKNIKVPTLLMSAENDPFLSETCYPKVGEIENSNFFFECPKYGGHVGFIQKRLNDFNLMDIKAFSFINAESKP